MLLASQSICDIADIEGNVPFLIIEMLWGCSFPTGQVFIYVPDELRSTNDLILLNLFSALHHKQDTLVSLSDHKFVYKHSTWRTAPSSFEPSQQHDIITENIGKEKKDIGKW